MRLRLLFPDSVAGAFLFFGVFTLAFSVISIRAKFPNGCVKAGYSRRLCLEPEMFMQSPFFSNHQSGYSTVKRYLVSLLGRVRQIWAPWCLILGLRQTQIAASNSTNAVSFSSARTTKRFPSPQCESAIQIVRPSWSKARLPTCSVFGETALYGGRNRLQVAV